MKPLRLLSCLAIFGGALAASSFAQLVHIAFTEGDYNNMVFRANDINVPWNHTGGYISRFDVWYDVNNPTDPTRNLWRANVFVYQLGNFEIIRPHDGPSFDGNYLTLIHDQPAPYESMDLFIEVLDNVSPGPGLPVPPFSIGSQSLFLGGGQSFYPVPDFGEGYGNGAFGRATVREVDSVVLYPVPEPSTYGLAAIAVLGAAVVWTRRRRASSGPMQNA